MWNLVGVKGENGMVYSSGVRYSPEIAKEILDRLAAGESLLGMCREEHLPDESSVRGWVTYDYNGFRKPYQVARDCGLDTMADSLLEIADDSRNDYMEKEGKTVLNSENIARSRLRVDTRKWYMAKLAPKRYGDRLTPEDMEAAKKFMDTLTAQEKAEKLERILEEAKAEKERAEVEKKGADTNGGSKLTHLC